MSKAVEDSYQEQRQQENILINDNAILNQIIEQLSKTILNQIDEKIITMNKKEDTKIEEIYNMLNSLTEEKTYLKDKIVEMDNKLSAMSKEIKEIDNRLSTIETKEKEVYVKLEEGNSQISEKEKTEEVKEKEDKTLETEENGDKGTNNIIGGESISKLRVKNDNDTDKETEDTDVRDIENERLYNIENETVEHRGEDFSYNNNEQKREENLLDKLEREEEEEAPKERDQTNMNTFKMNFLNKIKRANIKERKAKLEDI